MRVGEPVYAVTFMAKVGEGELARALSVLRNDTAPVLRRSGFRELVVVARRRGFEKLDPEGPGFADSRGFARDVRRSQSMSRCTCGVPEGASVLAPACCARQHHSFFSCCCCCCCCCCRPVNHLSPVSVQ